MSFIQMLQNVCSWVCPEFCPKSIVQCQICILLIYFLHLSCELHINVVCTLLAPLEIMLHFFAFYSSLGKQHLFRLLSFKKQIGAMWTFRTSSDCDRSSRIVSFHNSFGNWNLLAMDENPSGTETDNYKGNCLAQRKFKNKTFYNLEGISVCFVVII